MLIKIRQTIWHRCRRMVNAMGLCLSMAQLWLRKVCDFSYIIHSLNLISVITTQIQVLSIYAKSGTKNGKHGWVPHITSIISASNISVQLFQHMFRNQFRIAYSLDTSSHGHTLSISHFALLQSTSFLFTLTCTPKLSHTALQISEADYQWYQNFHSLRQNIGSAIKVMQAKNLKTIIEDEVDEDE